MNKTNSNDLLFEGKNFLFTQNALEGDKSQMTEKIQNLGGNVLARYLKKLNYIVATEEDKKDPPKKLKQAMGWKDTSIVGLDFIEKCIDEDKIIANDEYLILSDDTVNSIKRALSDAEDDDKVSKINKVTILDQNTAKKMNFVLFNLKFQYI
ncbi:hypothetical protein K502DRAFT_198279 [Neoconidiobolus thromboides FSU 785]|nr:hypothetical protein K502DRAFT_198279 [Neoconidiobolus thromboides FSU 785]